ncbi:MAG: sugar phosphate isomerase/epimerase [Anaerolineales bacterium]|nr:sugar phosphate isomerase/epimerase [Anaerolineales bacterium]
MAKPLALQLYTLREQLAQDFAGTLRQVAALGYAGVETAGQYGSSPAHARRLLDDLGLAVVSAHMPLPLGPDQARVLETAQALGVRRLICAWQPPERFNTADQVRAVCAELNAASAAAQAHGLTLGYHNHWFEHDHLIDGRPAHDWMVDWLAPEVFFEIDVYWVQTAGRDPAAVVRALGARAPLLHIKDGPAVHDAPMTAVGAGRLDFAPIVAASAADWLIVELDRCATDMLTAVAHSYQYLAAQGWGHGKN